MYYVWDILVVSRGLNPLLWKESKLNFRIWATASVSKARVFPQLLAQKSSALLCEPIEMQHPTPRRVRWRTERDTRDPVWVVPAFLKAWLALGHGVTNFPRGWDKKIPAYWSSQRKLGCSIHCGYSVLFYPSTIPFTLLLTIQLGRMGMVQEKLEGQITEWWHVQSSAIEVLQCPSN